MSFAVYPYNMWCLQHVFTGCYRNIKTWHVQSTNTQCLEANVRPAIQSLLAILALHSLFTSLTYYVSELAQIFLILQIFCLLSSVKTFGSHLVSRLFPNLVSCLFTNCCYVCQCVSFLFHTCVAYFSQPVEIFSHLAHNIFLHRFTSIIY